MAKNKVSEWSSTASNNTDIGGIDIAENCAPSGINNGLRTIMAQIKNMITGADGDNFTVGGNLTVTGTTTLTGDATAPTQSSSDNSSKVATTAYVKSNLTSLVTSITGGTSGLNMTSTTGKTVVISSATPAVLTVTTGADLPTNGTQITFTTTGTIPTGMSLNTAYTVANASGTTFNITLNGSLVNTTSSGTGTHSFFPLATTGNIEVTGTLNVGNGGTGLPSLTPNAVIVGNGSGALQLIRPNTAGNILTSTAGSTVNAGSFVVGTQYTISSTGSTDFTTCGAANSNVGTVFVATGAGAGSGQATINTWTSAAPTSSSLTLLATITTTSGSSQTSATISLTGYKQVQFIFNKVSVTSTSSDLRILDGSTNLKVAQFSGTASNFLVGFMQLDLGTGVYTAMTQRGDNTVPSGGNASDDNTVAGITTFSTATTSFTFNVSAGTFDAGSILVYGIK